jgi:ribose transport system permease protein
MGRCDGTRRPLGDGAGCGDFERVISVNRLKRLTPSLSTPGGSIELDDGQTAAKKAVGLLAHFSMVWALILLAIVSDILYPGFFDIGNLRNILSQYAPVGMVAIGMTFVMIAGGFDLSVAAIYAMTGVAFATFAGSMSLPLAFAAALGVGLAAGMINGLVITRLHVNPFVATLGSSSVFVGAAYLYSHNSPVVPEDPSFLALGTNTIFGVPASIVIFFAIYLVGSFVLAKTVYGRSIYAVGGNAEAARLAGIRVDLIRFSTYLLTGLTAAIAGMIIASRSGVGQADVGSEVTLESIAMVIIGGTSLLGGEGAMWRTLVGILILATISNLFTALAFDTATQQLVKGLIVIAAVALDAYIRRRRASA